MSDQDVDISGVSLTSPTRIVCHNGEEKTRDQFPPSALMTFDSNVKDQGATTQNSGILCREHCPRWKQQNRTATIECEDCKKHKRKSDFSKTTLKNGTNVSRSRGN